MMGARIAGWSSRVSRAGGVVSSDQRAQAPGMLVEASPGGALRLGVAYWREVGRVLAPLVTSRAAGAPQVRLLGLPRPLLMRFEAPHVVVDDDEVRVTYRIAGGVLVRRPGGDITLAQRRTPPHVVRSTVSGFRPTLPAPVYRLIQSRLHVAISRRYFRRLMAGARR
jgi:hypothetical protein